MSGQNRSEDARRKPTRGHNRSEDVRRRSSEIERKPMKGRNWRDSAQRTSSEIERKLMKGQNWSDSALGSSKIRLDAQHSKSTYVPAIHSSRNHSVSRQTRISARRASSLARKTSRAQPS
jgi:hypothetical protein